MHPIVLLESHRPVWRRSGWATALEVDDENRGWEKEQQKASSARSSTMITTPELVVGKIDRVCD
jgi:hypothetical protein